MQARGRARTPLISAAFVALAVISAASPARADPQASVGITVGAAGVSPSSDKAQPQAGLPRGYWKQTDFHLGLRGDVMFLRQKNADFGIGPYAEVLTNGFDQIQFGGGGNLLLPVLDSLPIVVSGGLYARKGDDRFGLTPGIAASLFWGSRSFNYHSTYVLAAGLLGEFRYGLGDNHETSIVVGAQIDLLALSLPFVFLASVVRGPSSEAAPVR